jgi:CDP-diacylglycerol--serine O-phosphatidyltransferase
MKLKHLIPNLLTLGNLAAGLLAVIFAADLRFDLVGYSVLFCFLFDFLDGTAARLLNAQSELGKELDSLADVVSFGAAPGLALYYYWSQFDLPSVFGLSVAYLAFLLPLFAARIADAGFSYGEF